MLSAMGENLTGVRVRAEGVGISGKTSITCLILIYDSVRKSRSGELALLAFASGQLAYSLSLLVTYILYFRNISLWPEHFTVDPSALRLSLTMTAQSVFKHVLTEGDKFMISWLSPLQDQGGYAIAVNYGEDKVMAVIHLLTHTRNHLQVLS